MVHQAKWFSIVLSLLLGVMSVTGGTAHAAGEVTLYTPYTKLSAPPGESVNYTIDVINNSKEVQNAQLAIVGLPEGWDYELNSGGWNIEQISILPEEKKSVYLDVEVPLKVDKGSYTFNVVASGLDSLPLTVTVSEQGTFKTELTSDQPNMEGHAGSSFTFNAELKNRTAEQQLYALKAEAPRGWEVTFKANYKQVTSVNVEPNQTSDINIEVNTPEKVEAGTYKIPVKASTNTTSAAMELEVVITGRYDMELTTPTGLLSTDITAGDEKRVELEVKNTGTAELQDVKLNFNAPINWDVTFNPEKIERIAPGDSAQVFATIKADKKAIAGDYVTSLEANTPEASSEASFRVAVKTSMLWGWVGVLIILAALGSVYYLFRKYGRR
jgi:uncharacterized membrane protein